MADAKTPTRPPLLSRRPRRDPREEEDPSPPPAEALGEVRARVPGRDSISQSMRSGLPTTATPREARLSPHEASGPPAQSAADDPWKYPPVEEAWKSAVPSAGSPSRAPALSELRRPHGGGGGDGALLLAKLAALEAEAVELRAQNEKDAAVMGQMLARVADRELETREARAETQRFEERASMAEALVAELQARLSDRELASAHDPFLAVASETSEPSGKGEALEEAVAGANARAEAAEARAAELEVRIAELEGAMREAERERSTATEVAADLAERVEVLESRVEGAEALVLSATEAKDVAEAGERAKSERLAELEAGLAAREARSAAAEMRVLEAGERAAAAEARATELAERSSARGAEIARMQAQIEALKESAVEAEKGLSTAEERDWTRAEELANARTEISVVSARVAELGAELAERTKEIGRLRAEQRASEAGLKKRHDESLVQQKSLFERQLASLETQLSEAKGARERLESLLKDVRIKSQEMQAEQASLEERLTVALDARDAVSRSLDALKDALATASRDAIAARSETANLRETVVRSSVALQQLEAIERDSSGLREQAARAMRAARSALEIATPPNASSAPAPAVPAPTPAEEALALIAEEPPGPPPTVVGTAEPDSPAPLLAPAPPAPPAPPTPREGSESSHAPSVVERLSPGPFSPNHEPSEAEISFAGVAPPPSVRFRTAASFPASSAHPTPISGTPARRKLEPASSDPLSDPRISIDEDEG